MRALIAAACVAIIAAVGYFFFGEWQEAQRSAKIARSIEAARAELVGIVGSSSPAHLQTFCEGNAGVIKAIGGSRDDKRIERNCHLLGYLD